MQASSYNTDGDYDRAKKAGKIALTLNLISLITGIVLWGVYILISVITTIATVVIANNSYSH